MTWCSQKKKATRIKTLTIRSAMMSVTRDQLVVMHPQDIVEKSMKSSNLAGDAMIVAKG